MTATRTAESPVTKKIKVDEKVEIKVTKPMEQAPDDQWPDAWLMPDEVSDQKALNRLEPNVPFSVKELRELGICYWKLDSHLFEYPALAVPWNPMDAVDPKLSKIRDDRGYSYADIITVEPDKLPGYDEKVKAFFEEHIHDAEEIRHVLAGSGFFDIRDRSDRWVRVHVKQGDLMTLPEGIYHRFTTDENDTIHAMRLFIGQPVWTPFNRPCDDHESRMKFVDMYLNEEEKEEKKAE